MKYLAVLAVSLILISGCVAPASTGVLQLKVTDAGNVSSLVLNISQIEVHMANSSEDSGWLTVNGSQSVDLIQVKGIEEILGETVLDEGKYTQIRLSFSDATVTIENQTYDLTSPSQMKFVHEFDIVANKITSIILDFDADKSIVEASDDRYLLKPTVKLITEFEGQ